MNTRRIPETSHGCLIANLLAQISLGLLAMTICLPSMQGWGAVFDAKQADVLLTFSAYVVAYGAVHLAFLMLAFTLCSVAAQALMHRR